jgi:molybdopterin-guanine dinucleotide biosynthesis protein A
VTSDISIAVLAGGKSRRMGRDKAQIELDGATLLERIAYVANLVAPTIVVGREQPDDFEFPRIPFVEDRQPGMGPIGGLQTALMHFDTPVALVGCDMPLMRPESIRWLADEAASSHAEHGLSTTRQGRVEPLFSVYRPACLTLIDEMVDAGERALHRLLERGDFDMSEAAEAVADTLLNVNTPDELEALRERL